MTRGARARRWLVAAGVAAGLCAPRAAFAADRAPYVHLLGGASVGRSLRFNNPFRLAEPLGDTAESVSLAAAYLDLSVAALIGLPWGPQHGLWVHNSLALTGIDQSVVSPSYVFLWRFHQGHALYGRGGPSIVMSPDLNVGFEAAAGGVYMLTGSVGLTGELVGSAYYGASTREVAATFTPLLSLQAGLVLDWEALP